MPDVRAGIRLPLDPLLHRLGFGPVVPKKTLAGMLGVSPRQVGRMLEEGVSITTADRICARTANLNPVTVWGSDFHDGIDVDALPDDPDLLFDPEVSLV